MSAVNVDRSWPECLDPNASHNLRKRAPLLDPERLSEFRSKVGEYLVREIEPVSVSASDALWLHAQAALLPEIAAALESARQFISNGIELGYIQMPEADTPDPAHNTLPKLVAVIAKIDGQR